MFILELSEMERNKLAHALEFYLSNLRMEIADTDSSFFKADLKTEKEVLMGILDRLEVNLEKV